MHEYAEFMKSDETEPRAVVHDPKALRALAHPQRLRLIDVLRSEGPGTVSELAKRVDDSIAATSYHLQQLAKYGHIEPREDLARNRRERWWQAKSRETVWLSAPTGEVLDSNALDSALINFQFERLNDFLSHRAEMDPTWLAASTLGNYQLTLTATELSLLHTEFIELLEKYRKNLEGGTSEGKRMVDIAFSAVPRN